MEHPPMPPVKKEECVALRGWDHWCSKPRGHKGPHVCPCGAGWTSKGGEDVTSLDGIRCCINERSTVRIAKLEAEVVRLKKEGTPGVMHEVDTAFYRLVVKERDTV